MKEILDDASHNMQQGKDSQELPKQSALFMPSVIRMNKKMRQSTWFQIKISARLLNLQADFGREKMNLIYMKKLKTNISSARPGLVSATSSRPYRLFQAHPRVSML